MNHNHAMPTVVYTLACHTMPGPLLYAIPCVTAGLVGFYRGWFAAYARAGPTFFVQMPAVEALRGWFGVDNI